MDCLAKSSAIHLKHGKSSSNHNTNTDSSLKHVQHHDEDCMRINDIHNNTNDDNNDDSTEMDENDTNNRSTLTYWDRLPFEILTKIFSYLTICETEAIERTCVAWKTASNDPRLWRRVAFNFDGCDSIRLVADAFRLISSKGHHLRDLTVTIGSPGLNQAWMMSGCIQQLLDYICQSPCRSIDTFRITNLTIFTQNRFFTLSKESILIALNNFLRSQRSMKHVTFSGCKFNPGEGLKILRTLKRFRHSLRTLELHHFFKRKYISVSKSLKIISAFSCLEEVGLDVDYISERTLVWLTEKSANSNRRPLRSLKIYFEAFRSPPSDISRGCWTTARQNAHLLRVSFDIEGVLHHQWMTPFQMDVIPLVQCDIQWDVFHRRAPRQFYADNLCNFINEMAAKQSSLLESFSLVSNMRSFPELEERLLALISACGKLRQVKIIVTDLSSHATETICAMLASRTHPVSIRLQTSTQSTSTRPRRLRRRGN